mmetsp:Transcript_25715/g.50341  ORF Transcript_25715/g.50341 Transcript_25715/m.50341 type:complete len:225 (-) Transcript_25715:1587-2261(-)
MHASPPPLPDALQRGSALSITPFLSSLCRLLHLHRPPQHLHPHLPMSLHTKRTLLYIAPSRFFNVLSEGALHCPRLEDHLFDLFVRVAQSHDCTTTPNCDSVWSHHGCPNDDVQIQSSGCREKPKAPTVDPPGALLDSVDDLHRPSLRCSSHAASRESGSHTVKPVETPVSTNSSPHSGHELVNRGVTLYCQELRDLHRSRLAHASEIVSHEVCNHEVLGSILL